MITRAEAEEQFYEWADTEHDLKRETIEHDTQRARFAETIICATERGRVSFCDGTIKYKLKYAVGGVEELTFNSRIKLAKLPANKKETEISAALRMIEAYTSTPLALLNDLDVFDFNRIAAIIAFFA